jgi:hypothetical protein
MAAIPLLFLASSRGAMQLFALVFGFALGGEYMIIPLVAAELFGVAVLGRWDDGQRVGTGVGLGVGAGVAMTVTVACVTCVGCGSSALLVLAPPPMAARTRMAAVPPMIRCLRFTCWTPCAVIVAPSGARTGRSGTCRAGVARTCAT